MDVVAVPVQVVCSPQRGPVHETPLPQTLVPPAPQIWFAGQLPHWMMLPQVSVAAPQLKPCWAHDFEVQTTPPHTLGELRPQVWPVAQVPHWMSLPHPSSAVPQSSPCCAHDLDTHASLASPVEPPLSMPLAPVSPVPASMPEEPLSCPPA